MKTYQLRDILPPKAKLEKDGSKLIISCPEELMQKKHVFFFKSVCDFKIINNNHFVKEIDDFETTLKEVTKYLEEQDFEYSGDFECTKIIEMFDKREKEFLYARQRGPEIKNSKVLSLNIPNFVKNRQLKQYQLLPVQHMIEVPNTANFSIPGSGKTTMTYAAYDVLKSRSVVDKLFVVGPLSSFKPWEEEFTNCFGSTYEDNVLRYAGTPNQRKDLINNFDDFEVILTNIPIVHKDHRTLKENLFYDKKIMLVLDESHHIKSFTENAPYANTMIDIGKSAKRRIILTGTPMPHDWPDLWSQITFLYPDEQVLGSRSSYRSAIEGIDVADHISDKIAFLWTRVTHSQMKHDLPKMLPKVCHISMSPLQSEIYRALENDWMDTWEQKSNFDIYEINELKRAKTLRLLQCVTNPGAITRKDVEFDLEPYETDNMAIMEKIEDYKEVPNKIAQAAELAKNLVEQGKNVVIWVYFKYNVKYLCKLLEEIDPIGISGEVPTETNDMREIVGRDDLIRNFKNSKGKVLVATLGSIAESVSLHRNEKGESVCHNAIYLERSFHAGQFMQSLFRLYRIGSPIDIPINNTFLSSTFEDGYAGTIDHEIHDRLNQRTCKMFRLMNDRITLPLNIDTHNYTLDGKAQLYDEVEDPDIAYHKIYKMIRKRQKNNKA